MAVEIAGAEPVLRDPTQVTNLFEVSYVNFTVHTHFVFYSLCMWFNIKINVIKIYIT